MEIIQLHKGRHIDDVDRAGIQDDPFDRRRRLGYGFEQTLLEIVDIEKHEVRFEPVDQEPRIGLRIGVVFDVVKSPHAHALCSAQDGVIGSGTD